MLEIEVQTENARAIQKFILSTNLNPIFFVYLGKALFAKCKIPKDTVLAVYPGDIIKEEEMLIRSQNRVESDRYVMQFGRRL